MCEVDEEAVGGNGNGGSSAEAEFDPDLAFGRKPFGGPLS